VGKPERKGPLENRGVNGRMGTICMLRRLAGRVWINSSGFAYRQAADFYDHGDESSGSGAMKLVTYLVIYLRAQAPCHEGV
jgi:hypothetical protein